MAASSSQVMPTWRPLGMTSFSVALDHRERLLLRRPELEGDEAAALLLDDQAVAHELGQRRHLQRPPVADQGDDLGSLLAAATSALARAR